MKNKSRKRSARESSQAKRERRNRKKYNDVLKKDRKGIPEVEHKYVTLDSEEWTN